MSVEVPTAASAVASLEPGAVVAHTYTLLHPLDSGAGGLWLARHERERTLLALQLLAAPPGVDRAEFDAAMQAVARLDHPSLMRVLDFGRHLEGDDELMFVATEWIKARTLTQVIQEDWPLGDARVVALISQLLDGVEAMHEAGMGHGDLRPAHILLRPDPNDEEREQLVLRGVGLAAFSPFHFDDLTHPDFGEVPSPTILGTPVYAAPEQLRGEPLDARSDVYGIGVLMFQLLTRSVPFSAACPHEVAFMQRFAPPSPPSAYAPVNPALEAVCLRALSKTPELRYQSAAEMRDALLATLPRPVASFSLRGSFPGVASAASVVAAAPSFRADLITAAPVETPVHQLALAQPRGSFTLVPAGLAAALALIGAIGLHSWLGERGEEAAAIALADASGSTSPTAEARSALRSAQPTAVRAPAAPFLPNQPDARLPPTPQPVAAGPLEPVTSRAPLEPTARPADEAAPLEHEAPSQSKPVALAERRNRVSAPARDGHAVTGLAPLDTLDASDRRPAATPAAAGKLTSLGRAREVAVVQQSVARFSAQLSADPTPRPDGPAPAQGPRPVSDADRRAATHDERASTEAMAVPNATLSPASTGPARPSEPHVLVGAASASRGSVSKSALRGALNLPSMVRCYRDSIKDGGSATPLTTRLEFATDLSGRVRSAKLHGEALAADLARCVEALARSGRVREADLGELRASVELTFSAR